MKNLDSFYGSPTPTPNVLSEPVCEPVPPRTYSPSRRDWLQPGALSDMFCYQMLQLRCQMAIFRLSIPPNVREINRRFIGGGAIVERVNI